jgi:hypothetical protein
MYWLKSCPRCGGDLVQTTDLEDYHVSCLQCGVTLTREQETALPRTTPPPKALEEVSRQFWVRALAPRRHRPAPVGAGRRAESISHGT